MRNRQRFREAINEFYTREALFKLFKQYFLDWIAEGYIGSNLGLFEISMITENSNKQTFIDLIEQMFRKDNFLTLYETLPEEIKKIMNHLAWKGKFPIKGNRDLYFKRENSYDLTKDLKPEFAFFRGEKDCRKDEYLTLDHDILRELRKLLPEKPEESAIQPIKDIDAHFISNDEKLFMENIKMFYDFYKQGGVVLSNSGKILKESKIGMKKYCNIGEYYENTKDLQHLKTETIGLFFHLVDEDYISSENFQTSNIRDLILNFMSGKVVKKEKFHYSFLYMNYLKGLKNIWNSEERLGQALSTIHQIIKEFPVTDFYNPVISIENIVKSVIYRDLFIELIDLKDAYDYIYINEANYERTKITGYDKYLDYVVVPFIKSVFFLLGALGAIEVYYDCPSMNNSLYLKNGHLSKFDGLRYVKLTELGKYIFGFTDSYQFKELKDEGEVYLDDDRLIVTIIGESPAKAMFFEKISQKIAPNKFKITRETFLKEISTREELENRISTFREKVNGDMFSNWTQFFSELLEKSQAVNMISEYTVLKLKNDKELLSCITKDEKLKSLVLKAEDYHILVKKDNMPKVIHLFKEYGYNIELPVIS